MPPPRELTIEEKAASYENMRHIHVVQTLLLRCVTELQGRMLTHDQTKLRDPEVAAFTEVIPRLKGSTYGSDEYKATLREIKPAIEHHNAHNRHHPEHFTDGISGMTLVDLLEMVCDWKAASQRHDDGDLRKSFAVAAERWGIEPQLLRVLENTADFFGWLNDVRTRLAVTQRRSGDPRCKVVPEAGIEFAQGEVVRP